MADKNGCEILTDAAWAVWEPLIEEVRPHGKTPPKELRRTISAIFWRHRNGAKWRSIPAELGPWWLAAQLLSTGPSRASGKACVIADGRGRAIAFALAPGQAHEPPLAPGLLDCLPDGPGWIVADRGLACDAFRERIWDLGARPAIPPKRTDAPVAEPARVFREARRLEKMERWQPRRE